MTNIDWVNTVVAVLSGIAVLIPLMVKLVEYVKKATQEKNWAALMRLTLDLMVQAEKDYETGAEKKEFVMKQLEILSINLNYEVDWEVISDMIDALCDMSKEVNVE